MAIRSGFFMSINGDRRYDAAFFAEYFASFIGNGIFPNPSTNLQVVEGGNMRTVVKPGKGWINGYYVHNDSDFILQHDVADGVLKRIDRVVMRLNYLTRQIEVAIKKGTFASSPVAPTLQRDGDYYELALADITINNGATQITQASITDTRLNKALCGIVHGTVNQVDTTTIFNQYQSWFNQNSVQKLREIEDFQTALENSMTQWMQQEQNDFETWFATIQDILDENVGATLAMKITTLEQTVDGLRNEVDTHLAEGAVDVHKASNISIVNPETTTAENLQTFAERLFTSVSNGKQAIGTAITDIDASVIVPSDPSFDDLANAVSQISSGKKWATGTALSTNVTNPKITVTGLDFKPSVIFTRTFNLKSPLGDFSLYVESLKYGAVENTSAIVDVYMDSKTAETTVNNNGFTIRGSRQNANLLWIAIE